MRLSKRTLAVLALIGLTTMSSCTLAKISGRGAKPILLNNPPREVEVVGQLDSSKLVTFDYTNSYDISEVAAEAMNAANGDAVINASFVVKGDARTFFINLFTIGLANARIFEAKADIVRYK